VSKDLSSGTPVIQFAFDAVPLCLVSATDIDARNTTLEDRKGSGKEGGK
jgi:hypothetical protein